MLTGNDYYENIEHLILICLKQNIKIFKKKLVSPDNFHCNSKKSCEQNHFNYLRCPPLVSMC